MNQQPNPLNVIQIDRLVDGELDNSERNILLLQAEETTGAWRQITLAYVEAQQWKRSFSQLLNEPATESKITPATFEKSRWVSIVVAGVAAALLLLFVGSQGYRMGKTKAEHQFVHQQTGQQKNLPEDFSKPTIQFISTRYQPETTMLQFKHPDTGEITEQEVMVIDPENPPSYLDEWIHQNEGEQFLPAELQRRLSQQGIKASMTRSFYTVPLEDGRQAIVPVDSTRLDYPVTENLQLQ